MSLKKTPISVFSVILFLLLTSNSFGQEDPRKTLDDYDPTIETEKSDQEQEIGTPATNTDSIVNGYPLHARTGDLP